jgi:peptidoglycan/xylan/chitin deacetylase (PgdA/CDA1 family)
MRNMNDKALRMGLDALYYSGAWRVMAPAARGMGAIFMLHRVCREEPDGFRPNRVLEVTAGFLDNVLGLVRARGFDVIDLDEAARRLETGDDRRFVVFTFDDGYADNMHAALPVFEEHGAPFTIYVTTGLPDGTADIWWLTLEAAIAALDRVEMDIGERRFSLPAGTVDEKQAAWDAVYWPLRDCTVAGRRALVAALGEKAGIEESALCRRLSMTWDEVRAAAAHPLVTIGGHTVHHFPLRALSEDEARAEIIEGRDRLAAVTGAEIRHFAYPFGDNASAGPRDFALAAEAGFRTAVTTRRGPLFAEHATHLHALPRVSLNGDYQALRYVELFLSGAPFLLWNRGRRLDVA